MINFPFHLKGRIIEESITIELWEEIEKIAGRYNLSVGELGASIEFMPDPLFPGTHFVLAQVKYFGEKKLT